MLDFIKSLIGLNTVLLAKVGAEKAYHDAVALRKDKKYAEAYPLLLQAAEAGQVMAMTMLGSAYLVGEGTKADGQAAVTWLERAVEAGSEEAVSVLGMALVTGKDGAKRDLVRGRQMLEFAAERGDAQAERMIEAMDKGQGIFKKSSGRKR